MLDDEYVAVKCTKTRGHNGNPNEGGHGTYFLEQLFVMRKCDFLDPIRETVDVTTMFNDGFIVYHDELSIVNNDKDLNKVLNFVESNEIRIRNYARNYN